MLGQPFLLCLLIGSGWRALALELAGVGFRIASNRFED
jgi:hypothetical protein